MFFQKILEKQMPGVIIKTQNMNTSTNPNIVVKNLNDFTSKKIAPTADRALKVRAVERAINLSKYNIVGLIDRTNSVILETRYYNVRDNKGRFARIVGNRKS